MTSTARPKPKPKPTDAERHKRFVDMAREVQAYDDPKDFEKAFKQVAPTKPGWIKTKIKIGVEDRPPKPGKPARR